MTPIRSALRTGPLRSKGYRSKTGEPNRRACNCGLPRSMGYRLSVFTIGPANRIVTSCGSPNGGGWVYYKRYRGCKLEIPIGMVCTCPAVVP
jgi:hypothetical protein